MTSEANPFGIQLTQQQLDESYRSRYWQHAVEYGVQYYVAGRFAAHARLTPVCASLLHHAVEMLLKACLAYQDTADQIRAYGGRANYGHSLPTLWQEFKRRNAALDLSAYDEIITRLQAFETIRYPEQLIEQGALLSVGLYEVDPPQYMGPGQRPVPGYVLMLPQIDRLAALLFKHTHLNPEAICTTQFGYGREHAATYLWCNNATPLLKPTFPEGTGNPEGFEVGQRIRAEFLGGPSPPGTSKVRSSK